MALRFKDDALVDDNGAELQIPFEEMCRACLTENYTTISVREIINEGIRQLTGEKVVGTRYRSSSLFNRLEAAVLADEKYQTAKKAVVERAKMYRKKNPEYIQSNRAIFFSRRLQRESMRRKQY